MAKLELCFGIAAVALVYRPAKGCGGLFQVAAPGERNAQVMPRLWELAVALLDCAIEGRGGFIEIASTEKRYAEILVSPGMIPAALPHDYFRYIDRGDRLRRSRTQPNGSRVRRGPTRRGEV